MQASDAMPTLWYPKTPVFPMRHAFIHGSSSGLNPDPTSSWVLVSMADFFAFLGSDGVKLCPIYVERTRKSPWLEPLTDYVTVAKDVGTQSGSRRYKYAEGLVNLQVTKKGALLPDHTDVLTVFRSCHKGCTALAWIEKVTTTNIKSGCCRCCSLLTARVHAITRPRASRSAQQSGKNHSLQNTWRSSS